MSIKIHAQLNPFSSEITTFEELKKLSIREILNKIDARKAVNTGWRVLVNDTAVMDFDFTPDDNSIIYIKVVPEGDNKDQGVGMKVGGAALVVLGVIIAVATAGTGLYAGIALVGSGLGLLAGGVVLYNLDIPSTKARESPKQDPSIRGSQNQLRPRGYIPMLFGRRRIYPDLAMTSFTWVEPESGSVYLYQLFCAGQKNQKIETDSIKIGETLLKDYSASGNINSILNGKDNLIEMKIAYGEDDPPLITKCVHEEQLNSALVNKTEEGQDGSIIRTTPDKTCEINVDIFFYNGLAQYDDEGKIKSASVEVRAEYKKAGESDNNYRLLGYFSKQTPSQKIYTQRFEYDEEGIQNWNENYAWENFSSWQRISGDSFVVNPLKKDKYSFSDIEDAGDYWKFSISYSQDFESFPSNNITAAELKTKRYAITKTSLESASYTVRVTRVTSDNKDTKVVDSVYVGSIRAIKNERPVKKEITKELTLIGLKIKASEKLNSVVERLNFISQSCLPIYDGKVNGAASWNTDATSSNPASAAMYAMRGNMAQQKLKDTDIDWESFSRLYNWCNEHEYKCNAYVTDSLTIKQLLSLIGSTCRAEITRLNGKISVIQDIKRDSFVQMFSPRNSRDYQEQIGFADVPDKIALPFVNEEAGFAEDETYVYNSPDGNEGREPAITCQDVQMWGVTKSSQVRRLGMYNYAVLKNRPIVHKFSTDIEYMLCRKGDWIKYAGDIALAGIAQGRLVQIIYDENSKITGVITDELLEMEQNKNYALRIRKSDGNSELLQLKTVEGANTQVIFLTPQENTLFIAEGDLFYFGTVGNDSIDLIITDITCGDNLSAELTCVEYAPEIFDVDKADFVLPEFESKITPVLAGVVDSGVYSEIPTTNFTVTEWATTSSDTVAPFNGWSTSAPQREEGRFIWMRIKTVYSDGRESYSKPVNTTGSAGAKGDDGAEYYGMYYQSFPSNPSIGGFFLAFDNFTHPAGLKTNKGVLIDNAKAVLSVKEINYKKGFIYVLTKNGWTIVEDRTNFRYVIALEDLLKIGGEVSGGLENHLNSKKDEAIEQANSYTNLKTDETLEQANNSVSLYAPKYLGFGKILSNSEIERYFFNDEGKMSSVSEKFSDIKNGDWFISINIENLAGSIVIAKNNEWISLNLGASGTSKYLDSCQSDLFNLGSLGYTIPGLSIVQNAMIKNLFSKVLTIMNGGIIKSSNFLDANGKEAFRLSNDGKRDLLFNAAQGFGVDTQGNAEFMSKVHIGGELNVDGKALFGQKAIFKGALSQGGNFYYCGVFNFSYVNNTLVLDSRSKLKGYKLIRIDKGRYILWLPPNFLYAVRGEQNMSDWANAPFVIREYISDSRKTNEDGYDYVYYTGKPYNTNPVNQLNISSFGWIMGSSIHPNEKNSYGIILYFTDFNSDDFTDPIIAKFHLFIGGNIIL
ncbi:host specificity factor TipJ family phage tail protein [Treponema pectinovorum]|uniref:host specificity factor TipJ family phage tail protein n=1 Tax=Treponema pectinovorum TaxID=164 RepID=UPI0011CCA16E|nr:host specificity factor TipJ family phage tail protein [Treponema pectinovorum]